MFIFLAILYSSLLQSLAPFSSLNEQKDILESSFDIISLQNIDAPLIVNENQLFEILKNKAEKIVEILEEEFIYCPLQSILDGISIEEQRKEQRQRQNRGYYTTIQINDNQFLLILKIQPDKYALLTAKKYQVEDYHFLWNNFASLTINGLHPVSTKQGHNLTNEPVLAGASIGFEIEGFSKLLLYQERGDSLYIKYKQKKRTSAYEEVPAILETDPDQQINISFDLMQNYEQMDNIEVRTQPIKLSEPWNESGENLANRISGLCHSLQKKESILIEHHK